MEIIFGIIVLFVWFGIGIYILIICCMILFYLLLVILALIFLFVSIVYKKFFEKEMKIIKNKYQSYLKNKKRQKHESSPEYIEKQKMYEELFGEKK